jgi:hypothetical protein
MPLRSSEDRSTCCYKPSLLQLFGERHHLVIITTGYISLLEYLYGDFMGVYHGKLRHWVLRYRWQLQDLAFNGS